MYVLKELNEIAPEGVQGDLYVAGDLVADGYLKEQSPTATSELSAATHPFIINPFVKEDENKYFFKKYLIVNCTKKLFNKIC